MIVLSFAFALITSFCAAYCVHSEIDFRRKKKDETFLCTTRQFFIFTFILVMPIAFIISLPLEYFQFSFLEHILYPWGYLGLFIIIVFTVLELIKRIRHYNLRLANEFLFKSFLFFSASFAFLVTLGIIYSLLSETFLFFEQYPMMDFFFGTQWSPQTALRADQVGSSGKFGILPILTGTILITVIALCVALPIGLGAAIYLSEFSKPSTRYRLKPLLEILAGIPTVVYGFFAAITVAPFIKLIGTSYGFVVSSESALAAGLVMGVMVIPYISSLTDDVLHAVPQSLRDGAYALGSTQTETILRIVLPAAFPGIVSSFILGFSRAIGETMIVLMAAGLAGNLTFNPLNSVTTFTVQIGTLLTGDQEFDSVKTLSAFALGATLFIITLILNIFAVRMIHAYRKKYV